MTGAMGKAIACAALNLVGTAFCLNGRSANDGVDCIGLAWLAMRACGIELDVPSGYALRNRDDRRWRHFFERSGFSELTHAAASCAGDFWLVKPAAFQAHLLVHGGTCFIHADAGLRSVVQTPWPCLWPVLSIWRFDGA